MGPSPCWQRTSLRVSSRSSWCERRRASRPRVGSIPPSSYAGGLCRDPSQPESCPPRMTRLNHRCHSTTVLRVRERSPRRDGLGQLTPAYRNPHSPAGTRLVPIRRSDSRGIGEPRRRVRSRRSDSSGAGISPHRPMDPVVGGDHGERSIGAAELPRFFRASRRVGPVAHVCAQRMWADGPVRPEIPPNVGSLGPA